MEMVKLSDVLDIVSQYCPDDDGSCSKAGVDMREMLDEIEALPTTEVIITDRSKFKSPSGFSLGN